MTAMSLHARPEPLPLAGFTVGVTAARRAAELGSLLERRGAEVLHAAAIQIVLRDWWTHREHTAGAAGPQPDRVAVDPSRE